MLKVTLFIIALLVSIPIFSIPYEASTLHNSVNRSETVQKIYFERWDDIIENNYNIDFFGKINWVNDFQIKTVDAGNGSRIVVPMRLIRTYGGVSLLYVFSQSDSSENIGLIGLTTSGFHYGLTKEIIVDRGSLGTTTTTDYKYTQFFDDIYSLTFAYNPYIILHLGTIVNNAIEPNDDGTISYLSGGEKTVKYFTAATFFSFLDLNINIDRDELETIKTNININNMYSLIFSKEIPYLPNFTVGYKKVKLYNDEPYDAVWVNYSKQSTDTKQSATLTTFSLLIEKNLSKSFALSIYTELQNESDPLIEKRTNNQLNLKLVREIKSEISYNYFYDSNDFDLIFSLGISRFWDPALAVHSNSASYYANGYNFSINFKTDYFQVESQIIYNDSTELKKLTETVDKLAIECGFSISTDYSKFFNKKKEKI